jgi:hypothetical protein
MEAAAGKNQELGVSRRSPGQGKDLGRHKERRERMIRRKWAWAEEKTRIKELDSTPAPVLRP